MAYRFEGSNYRKNGNLSRVEIAKRIREEYAKLFPYSKISVTTESYSGGQSIDVSILDIGFNPFTPKYIEYIESDAILTTSFESYLGNERGYRQPEIFNEKAVEIRKIARDIQQSYNYDDSDSQTDYFNVNFYGGVSLDSTSHIILYLPESGYAKSRIASRDKDKERDAKNKEIRKANAQSVKFSYGQVVIAQITYRKAGLKNELAIIKKAPLGSGGRFYYAKYDIDLLTKIEDSNELKRLIDYENEYFSYNKNRRNKYIGLVYVEGVPYKTSRYLKDIFERNISEYEGNYTHKFKEFTEAKNKPKDTKKAMPKAKEAPQPKATPQANKNEVKLLPGAINATVTKNDRLNGIEVKFDGIPSDQVREYLKENGFKWSNFSKVWYAKYSSVLFEKIKEKLLPNQPEPEVNSNASNVLLLKAKALKVKRLRLELELEN